MLAVISFRNGVQGSLHCSFVKVNMRAKFRKSFSLSILCDNYSQNFGGLSFACGAATKQEAYQIYPYFRNQPCLRTLSTDQKNLASKLLLRQLPSYSSNFDLPLQESIISAGLKWSCFETRLREENNCIPNVGHEFGIDFQEVAFAASSRLCESVLSNGSYQDALMSPLKQTNA